MMNGGREFFQRLAMVGFPVFGKKVVVGDIDQNPAAMTQFRIQAFFAAAKGSRRLGKAIELTVVNDAMKDFFRQPSVEGALDIIPEQGAQSGTRVRFDQIEVQQVVQRVCPVRCAWSLRLCQG